MKCGEFSSLAKNRVVLQKPIATDTDTGGQSIEWKTFATVWAYIKPISGNQNFSNEKITSRATHSILIRYIAEIRDVDQAGKCRAQFDGKTLEVDYIFSLDEHAKDYGNFFQKLICVENGAGNAG